MKVRSVTSNDVESRKRRALAVIARVKPEDVPRGIDLIDFRALTSAERAYGKSLEPRARALRKDARHARKIRKLASAH
jgi:hypothetical protein